MAESKIISSKLLENLHVGVVAHSPDTAIVYANPKALELLRLTEDQACGRSAFDPHWHFVDKFTQVMRPESYPVNFVLANNQPISNLEVGIHDSSSQRYTWVLCNAYPEYDDDGRISQVVVTFIDITKEKTSIPFYEIVELASDIVLVTEASPLSNDGPRIVYVNQAFTKLTGYSKAEVIGKTPRILQGEDTADEAKYAIQQALLKQEAVSVQILNYSKAGDSYWLDLNIFPLKNENGEVSHFVAFERDISDQKLIEHKLIELSIRDPLTGMLNRRGFFELVQSHISQTQRVKKELSIVLVDIDHFKRVNDQFGHDIGDQVLVHLCKLMVSYFRDSDCIGRMGGEEFAILLSNSNQMDTLKKLQKFRQFLIEHPLALANHDKPITISLSGGISSVTEPYNTVTELLKTADVALYKAKNSGRDCFVIAENDASK